MNHKYIVQFKHFFEDNKSIYILLELCDKKSLVDLIQQRAQIMQRPIGQRGLSELEVRYFMTQIVSAVEHLHSKRVVHRDLSLKNVFLGSNFDQDMQVKIGDFGMSIQLEQDE